MFKVNTSSSVLSWNGIYKIEMEVFPWFITFILVYLARWFCFALIYGLNLTIINLPLSSLHHTKFRHSVNNVINCIYVLYSMMFWLHDFRIKECQSFNWKVIQEETRSVDCLLVSFINIYVFMFVSCFDFSIV